MNIGMLWSSPDPRKPATVKIAEAMAYYQAKYGKRPNLIFVNPSNVAETQVVIEGVEIRTAKNVLPNHYWIGVDVTRQAVTL